MKWPSKAIATSACFIILRFALLRIMYGLRNASISPGPLLILSVFLLLDALVLIDSRTVAHTSPSREA